MSTGRSVAFPGHPLGSGLTTAAAKARNFVLKISLIDAHAGGVGVMASVPELAFEAKGNWLVDKLASFPLFSNLVLFCFYKLILCSEDDEEAICHRMVLVCGTSTCHMAVSQSKLFIPGVWGPYWSGTF